MPAWRDWDDPFDDTNDGCWEPTADRENDETRGWRLRETSDGPRKPMLMWRREEVEAQGGVFDCPYCASEFALVFATLCLRCGRRRAEWEALQLKAAA